MKKNRLHQKFHDTSGYFFQNLPNYMTSILGGVVFPVKNRASCYFGNFIENRHFLLYFTKNSHILPKIVIFSAIFTIPSIFKAYFGSVVPKRKKLASIKSFTILLVTFSRIYRISRRVSWDE